MKNDANFDSSKSSDRIYFRVGLETIFEPDSSSITTAAKPELSGRANGKPEEGGRYVDDGDEDEKILGGGGSGRGGMQIRTIEKILTVNSRVITKTQHVDSHQFIFIICCCCHHAYFVLLLRFLYIDTPRNPITKLRKKLGCQTASCRRSLMNFLCDYTFEGGRGCDVELRNIHSFKGTIWQTCTCCHANFTSQRTSKFWSGKLRYHMQQCSSSIKNFVLLCGVTLELNIGKRK